MPIWISNTLKALGQVFWNIPDGFATLIAGSMALIAAFIAWRGIQAQITAQEKLETNRKSDRLKTLYAGLTSELLVFSAAIIGALSIHNKRAIGDVQNHTVRAAYPVFPEPLVYKSLISQLGEIQIGWPAAAIITFYANLLDLNDASREAMQGRHTANIVPQIMAQRLRLMAINLAEALNGLRSL